MRLRGLEGTVSLARHHRDVARRPQVCAEARHIERVPDDQQSGGLASAYETRKGSDVVGWLGVMILGPLGNG